LLPYRSHRSVPMHEILKVLRACGAQVTGPEHRGSLGHPHVRAFYANYLDPEQHAPFYRQSSRQ
jgi:hypothetical protein